MNRNVDLDQSGPESAPSQGMADKIKLDSAVQTACDLNLASSAVSLQGMANLRVVGTSSDRHCRENGVYRWRHIPDEQALSN